MNCRRIIFCFSLIVYSLSFIVVSAQQHKIDSLYAVLKTEKEDTNKVKTLNNLSNRFDMRSEYLKADSVATCALQLAKKLNYADGIGSSYLNIGNFYISYGGNYAEAMKNFMMGLDAFEAANDLSGKGKIYGGLGSIYLMEADYPDALTQMLQSLKIAEQKGDNYTIGVECGNMGLIYYNLGNYTEAMKSYERALKVKEQTGNKRGMGNTYGNMGNVYEAQGNYPQALIYYLMALDIAKETGNRYGQGNIYSDIGSIYNHRGDYASALKYQLMSLAIEKDIDNKEDMCTTYLRMAQIFISAKKPLQAGQCVDTTLRIAKQIGSKGSICDAYAARATVDSLKGNYATALADVRMCDIWKDSLKNEATSRKIVSEQLSYDFDKKRASEKAEQDKKDSIASEDRKKQLLIRNLFIAGFVLMLILAFYILRGYRQKIKANAIITKQKEDMERLSIVARETDNLVLIMDADGTVEWANESFVRVNGITIEELKKLKGNTIYEISNNPNIRNIINTAVSERRSVVYESFNDRKEGARQWESSTLTPIFNGNGTLHKLIIVDADITLRKVAEETISAKNKDITDSIHYASRIQNALLTTTDYINSHLKEYFIFFKPRDIVSGDFYWMLSPDESQVMLAACDCTGHGVPGAFMSLLSISMLNETVVERKVTSPDKVLNDVRANLIKALNPKGGTESKDGMDCVLCSLDLSKNVLHAACANNPILIVRGTNVIEIEPDKMPIGMHHGEQKPFTLHTVQLQKGDTVYLFTDGYADQFGGTKGKKFMYKQLKEKLSVISNQPMQEQKRILEETFNTWKGNLEQVDDILVMGIRV